jgi:hypothetical protein
MRTCGQLVARLRAGLPPELALKAEPETVPERRYEAFGQSKTLRDWAQDPCCAVGITALAARLHKGMPIEKALTLPARVGIGRSSIYSLSGEAKSLQEWSEDPRCEIGYDALIAKVRAGVPLDMAMKRLSRVVSHHESALFEAFGEKKTIQEWVRDPRCKISDSGLRSRLRRGTDFETALTEPSKNRRLDAETAMEVVEAVPWHVRTPKQKPPPAPKRVKPTTLLLRPEDVSFDSIRAGRVWFEAFGEIKNLREWALDPRCELSEEELRLCIEAGCSTFDIFHFQRQLLDICRQ